MAWNPRKPSQRIEYPDRKTQRPPAAEIDAKVLERRQRDLEGYLEKYQTLLEKRQRAYGRQIWPVWLRTAERLKRAVDDLYRQFGTKGKLDPSRFHQSERLRYLRLFLSYLAEMIPEQAEKLQRSLAFEYSRSYYFHAFGMEQAAQVAIVVPLLTTSQVMGVLANPWLPDEKTYSDRIRANTGYLAQKMGQAVEEAVTGGWSVQQTARRIEEIAGEGYHNAVRLARTELTRAAGQGASHLYMQNADILDDKRWNATLDARTAPKDAANDGKVYPLEYDTPEHKGRPGERIPNHPNCRCRWSPVLSALGISTRERIARGDGDSTDRFGERIYTQARTYEEYAKERGLPSMAERLANDDPRRYLRNDEMA